ASLEPVLVPKLRPSVYCAQGKASARTPHQRNLKRVVAIVAAAGLVVDFAEWAQDVRAAVVNVEFTNDDSGQGRIRIRVNSDDPICNASQEEVPPLASNISRSSDKPSRKLALNRKVVLINPF